MAILNYKKYKVSLQPDSKKVQGLKVGDIVRRQYTDGTQNFYSMMCVLECGEDVTDQGAKKPYFIGALLEGSAPQSSELLDFVRVTNLFDTSRSGALYLTAADSQSPYMDVIDGIAVSESLCWPDGLVNPNNIDTTRQYGVTGTPIISATYTEQIDNHQRVCKLTKTVYYIANSFAGLVQEFNRHIAALDCVLVSYKIKASSNTTIPVSLGYADGSKVDAQTTVSATSQWEYKLHALTIDWSGKHTRSLKFDLSPLRIGESVWIADLNVIVLSSLSDFGKSSHARIGKLNGVNDPVFGSLDGYGGYLQRLFASKSAHVSGTLTAGDEHGFGATFYAGKIHKNTFVNSIAPQFVRPINSIDVASPTGIGNTYEIADSATLIAQTTEWLAEHQGMWFCFSCWVRSNSAAQIQVLQNDLPMGSAAISTEEVGVWKRISIPIKLISQEGRELLLSIRTDTPIQFSSPQMELGKTATQYQPTDHILQFTDDYGAWFSRGGVGGTIQNPLLQLNYDGKGGIGTRNKSLALRADGSGYLANQNILWDSAGRVSFTDKVTLTWDNLDGETKNDLLGRSIKIIGSDTFTILKHAEPGEPSHYPNTITLTIQEENIQSTPEDRTWYYLRGEEYLPIVNEHHKSLVVSPNSVYWGEEDTLSVKCVITHRDKTYEDVFTIKKQYVIGYSVEVSSQKGVSFKNGACQTTLKADVYYKGKRVDPAFVDENFSFLWRKYTNADLTTEDEEWWKEKRSDSGELLRPAIDRGYHTLQLDYNLTGSDVFVCELHKGKAFTYSFPILFEA